MNLKIIEPITHPNKEFRSPDEFNLWYNKNKESVDALTTHKLNKMYHIEGYRITKIKGVMMLKKMKEPEEENYVETQIEQLRSDIDQIKKAIGEIIKVVNGEQQ